VDDEVESGIFRATGLCGIENGCGIVFFSIHFCCIPLYIGFSVLKFEIWSFSGGLRRL